MITSKDAKILITEGARELFPRILPSRLQEARSSLLSHLGMDIGEFGYYCSQVVKSLKANGEMSTSGWEWTWVGGTIDSTPKPSEPIDMINMLSFDMIEEEVESPSLYDLTCVETVIRLVATTTCFGKVVQSDSECQGCPLFDLCLEKKGEVKVARKEAKLAKEQAFSKASEQGYNIRNIKPPKSARIHEAIEYECKSDTTCIVSGDPILKGETATHIPSWGMVKSVIAEAYKSLHNI